MKKLEMIFDATLISNGCNKNCNRSGIYFVGYNILKQFINSQKFNITLYCQQERISDLKKVIKEYFPNETLNIITDKNYTKRNDVYNRVKQLKNEAKYSRDIVLKTILQITMNLIAILRLINKLNVKFRKEQKNHSDIFFSPIYKIPEDYKNIKNLKSFLILYDAIPRILPKLTAASDPNSWWMQMANSLNENDYYFAISESARQDFLRFYPAIQKNHITTTLLACDETYEPSTNDLICIKEKYNIPQETKYIFSLCNLDPRKNLIRNVKTYIKFCQKHNITDMSFVLGGGAFDKFLEEFKKEFSDDDIKKYNIIRAGYIDDEDLAPLYSGAEWFVYTSQYEGFGLPPLEAMSCGCPIITSNNSSLPEVIGNAGIMIDWDSDEQHIQAYEKYYFDQEYKSKMAQKGLERSKQFSWEKCANIMIEKIIGVCK